MIYKIVYVPKFSVFVIVKNHNDQEFMVSADKQYTFNRIFEIAECMIRGAVKENDFADTIHDYITIREYDSIINIVTEQDDLDIIFEESHPEYIL